MDIEGVRRMWVIDVHHKMHISEFPEKVVEDHINYLTKLREDRTIMANGRYVDGSGGLILLPDCPESVVQKVIADDPFNHFGQSEYVVREWEGLLRKREDG